MEMSRFSEEVVAAVVPIIVYCYSGVHMALGHARFMDKYRLKTKEEEDSKNMVSKRAVLLNVLAMVTGERGRATKASGGSYLTAARMAVAVLLFDAYRYAWHHLAHNNRFLYRYLYSWHHRIVVPYSFDAVYGHPIEVLIDDTVSGLLAVLVSGLSSSPRAMAVC